MKPNTPSSYFKMFQITPGTTLEPCRAIFITPHNNTNSLGIKFQDGTGVTLTNLGLANYPSVLPVIAKSVISASGLTAYGML